MIYCSRILILVCSVASVVLAQPQTQPQGRGKSHSTETERFQAELAKLAVDVAALKSDPTKAKLEKEKLEQEVAKLRAEVAALRNATDGAGQLLPWLQAVGLGSLIGGCLVLLAGRKLSSVQQEKLKQELKFTEEDHKLQREKLVQDLETSSEEHKLQSKKLKQEMEISRSAHSLKLFEALGAQEPRIRIGASSELGQRVRELNEALRLDELTESERSSNRRECQAIIRVLIAVSKHEDSEELQKHIADLIVDLLEARALNLPKSPLAEYDFQGVKLTNAWWKGVDARGVDFYKASLQRAGLTESRLSKAIFKNANLQGATLRGAAADEANFEGADLSEIKASDAIFTKARLYRAIFRGAHLERAHLDGANLDGADFSDAHLDGAHFEGAYLGNAIFPMGFKAKV